MSHVRVGFALCGSFCTFSEVIKQMEQLVKNGAEVTPIMSTAASTINTRFGLAEEHIEKIEKICGKKVIKSIEDAEPIGPKKMFDILIVAPCTGNTLAKLRCSVTDTPVLMAIKSHLRNNRPVLIAVSTNDGLSASAKNIGYLMNQKNIYFVPFAQDDPILKPSSAVADFTKIQLSLHSALEGKQIQPVLLSSPQYEL